MFFAFHDPTTFPKTPTKMGRIRLDKKKSREKYVPEYSTIKKSFMGLMNTETPYPGVHKLFVLFFCCGTRLRGMKERPLPHVTKAVDALTSLVVRKRRLVFYQLTGKNEKQTIEFVADQIWKSALHQWLKVINIDKIPPNLQDNTMKQAVTFFQTKFPKTLEAMFVEKGHVL